jgi:hypothetical protein
VKEVVDMLDLTAETAAASTVHHPFGSPSGPGLFHVKGMQLPAYIQNVAHGLLTGGAAHDEASAIQMAVGIIKNWASGFNAGHKVHPDVQAAAAKALAEWEAAKARAHAQGGQKLSRAQVLTVIDLIREVRTAAGVKFYHMPIGSPIVGGKSHDDLLKSDYGDLKKTYGMSIKQNGHPHETSKALAKAVALHPDGPAMKKVTKPTPPVQTVTKADEDALKSVEQQVRDAYAKLSKSGNNYVTLADLRDAVPADRSRVDDTLKTMSKTRAIDLVPESNRKALTDRDHAAAIKIGGEDQHLISIPKAEVHTERR